MYCAYDDENNIIAFHDEKRAVETYIDGVYHTNNIILKMGKIKKENRHLIRGKDDLYLVRYGDTFIQTGYIDYIIYSSDQIIEDNTLAMDILYRLLETERLTQKETKTIRKAVKIMEEITKEDKRYTPSLEDLKKMKLEYDPYLYNTGLYDYDK